MRHTLANSSALIGCLQGSMPSDKLVDTIRRRDNKEELQLTIDRRYVQDLRRYQSNQACIRGKSGSKSRVIGSIELITSLTFIAGSLSSANISTHLSTYQKYFEQTNKQESRKNTELAEGMRDMLFYVDLFYLPGISH